MATRPERPVQVGKGVLEVVQHAMMGDGRLRMLSMVASRRSGTDLPAPTMATCSLLMFRRLAVADRWSGSEAVASPETLGKVEALQPVFPSKRVTLLHDDLRTIKHAMGTMETRLAFRDKLQTIQSM